MIIRGVKYNLFYLFIKINKMSEKDIAEIKEKIDRIEIKLDALLEKMDISVEGTTKISEHIDFVENVFDTVKTPLSYICNKVNIFASGDQGVLENIKTRKQMIEMDYQSASSYDSASESESENSISELD